MLRPADSSRGWWMSISKQDGILRWTCFQKTEDRCRWTWCSIWKTSKGRHKNFREIPYLYIVKIESPCVASHYKLPNTGSPLSPTPTTTCTHLFFLMPTPYIREILLPEQEPLFHVTHVMFPGYFCCIFNVTCYFSWLAQNRSHDNRGSGSGLAESLYSVERDVLWEGVTNHRKEPQSTTKYQKLHVTL